MPKLKEDQPFSSEESGSTREDSGNSLFDIKVDEFEIEDVEVSEKTIKPGDFVLAQSFFLSGKKFSCSICMCSSYFKVFLLASM